MGNDLHSDETSILDSQPPPVRGPGRKPGWTGPADVPALHRGRLAVLRRHHDDPGRQHPYATAVKLHCLSCVGWVRKDVADCTSTVCPLWPVRPYRVAR